MRKGNAFSLKRSFFLYPTTMRSKKKIILENKSKISGLCDLAAISLNQISYGVLEDLNRLHRVVVTFIWACNPGSFRRIPKWGFAARNIKNWMDVLEADPLVKCLTHFLQFRGRKKKLVVTHILFFGLIADELPLTRA